MSMSENKRFTVAQLQNEIVRMKKEKDVCILAHSYQAREICEIADFTGDSFGLSVNASKVKNKTVILCGVRFMAETVKLLSPEKKVILSHAEAGCPMAEQMDKSLIQQTKKQYPDYTVVAYINTTTLLKTVCDVCVTSSSAVKIVGNIENKNILFIPDINLGSYVAQKLPEKNIKLLSGGCPVHASITEKEALQAKELHPDALLLVHPECVPAVVKHADFVGSTKEIMDYAAQSDKKEFIIGTENSIVEHLSYDFPQKSFFALSKNLVCNNMKLTTLMDVYKCLCENGGEEIVLDKQTAQKARRCIDEMLRLG